MLGVTTQDLGKSAVVRCVGRIVVGETSALRNAVLSQVNRQTVVLDLTRVDAIDDGGVGVLVFLQGWARGVGIDLQLLNPGPHVRELSQLTNLDSGVQNLLVRRHSVESPVAITTTNGAAA